MARQRPRRPRLSERLSVDDVQHETRSGRWHDGRGLYHKISPSGDGASYVFRYQLHGRRRDMGLGSSHDITLTQARQLADDARALVARGIDPLEHRTAEQKRREGAGMTFADCFEAYVSAQQVGWKGGHEGKQAKGWRSNMTRWLGSLASLPVAEVDGDRVLAALTPLWHRRPQTAAKLRGRIEAVLDWAKAKGFRQGENPARWRGNLKHLLPSVSKIAPVRHHAALDFTELPTLMAKLGKHDSVAARGLAFLILTASRTDEVIGATWEELDVTGKLWTVPAARMKSGRVHRVPLSVPALTILAEMQAARISRQVFPGQVTGKPLSNRGLLHSLHHQIDYPDLTVHGFRATFKTWCGERTRFPREVAEAALAHVDEDAVEAAYRRGEFLMKRRQLMDAWAAYATRVPGVVVAMPA
jgi:integrase